MESTSASLTVFFEDPFWVAVYQRMECGRLRAAKVVFGKEPKECEIYAYFLNHWGKLRFGPPVEAQAPKDLGKNPKRVQRQVKGQLQTKGVGTKAQQAVKAQQEAGNRAAFWPAKPGPKRKGNGFLPCGNRRKRKNTKGGNAWLPGGMALRGAFCCMQPICCGCLLSQKRRQGLCCPSTARGNHCQGKFAARLSSGRGLMLY